MDKEEIDDEDLLAIYFEGAMNFDDNSNRYEGIEKFAYLSGRNMEKMLSEDVIIYTIKNNFKK